MQDKHVYSQFFIYLKQIKLQWSKVLVLHKWAINPILVGLQLEPKEIDGLEESISAILSYISTPRQ